MLYSVQSGNDRKATTAQVNTYTAGATATLTNKTFDTAGTGNSLSINGVAATANTGTGAVVRASSPTLTTPVISQIANTGTITLPTSTDTLVGKATTDVLTNKTLSAVGTGNIVQNIWWTPTGGASGAAVTTTTGTGQTQEQTLATITIAAGSLGANGQIRVTTLWSCTASSNTKTIKVRYSTVSGTSYLSSSFASTTILAENMLIIRNKNATNSQIGYVSNAIANGPYGQTTGASVTSAVDTTASTTIVITGQLSSAAATANEVITLESFTVELLYSA